MLRRPGMVGLVRKAVVKEGSVQVQVQLSWGF
jgi:hypothetical protein